MPSVPPVPLEETGELRPMLERAQQLAGFVPNSYLIMAHRPRILETFSQLVGAVMGRGTVSRELKQLVALMSSTAAGCRYCQAHTSTNAAKAGASPEKVAALYEFESSPLFTPAERAALRLARDAGLVPNATTPEHFVDLREHFDDGDIVEIVAMISLFGWLNRWNDTMATPLEDEPLAFALETLGPDGWAPGKHAHG